MININAIEGDLRPINDRVLVTDMHFGQQTTQSGIIIADDDGTTRGIYPRWAQVYAKGPENSDDYAEGDWILVEHGRWTRSVLLDVDGDEVEVRMVEAESVLAVSSEKPQGVQFGDGD